MLENELKETDLHPLFLLTSSADQIISANINVVREVVSKGCAVLMITANQPYKMLMRTYEKEGIDTSHIWFIDAVTISAGGTPPDTGGRARFINNPGNLTDLGIAITESLKYIPEPKKCIIFDSVSIMLIYSSSVNLSRFLHFVANKLRLADVSGIFLCVEKGIDPVLLSQITSYVDRIIEGDKGVSV
jgi:hypothetical protein